MDLSRLQELKNQLLQEKQLSPVWTYFLDHFAESPAFIQLGERTTHELVEAVLAQVGQQLYGKTGTIQGLILTRVEEQGFLHGACMIGGRIGGVFFFEDVNMGMVAVAENPPSIEAKYARFSTRPVLKTPEPSQN